RKLGVGPPASWTATGGEGHSPSPSRPARDILGRVLTCRTLPRTQVSRPDGNLAPGGATGGIVSQFIAGHSGGNRVRVPLRPEQGPSASPGAYGAPTVAGGYRSRRRPTGLARPAAARPAMDRRGMARGRSATCWPAFGYRGIRSQHTAVGG